MEIWDGYLSDGTLAGIDLERGKPIPDGLYFLAVEILVRHTDGDYLLSFSGSCGRVTYIEFEM